MASLQTIPISVVQRNRLADESGVEYVHGQIVEKPVSIESSVIAASVSRILGNAAAEKGLAGAFDSSMGYQCFADDPTKFRKPDVSVVRSERMADIDSKAGFFHIAPDLAVEVLSPNDLAYEINDKVEDYLLNGFASVWIIHPNTRSVTVRHADGSIFVLHEQDEITASPAIPDFRCKVAEFFPGQVKSQRRTMSTPLPPILIVWIHCEFLVSDRCLRITQRISPRPLCNRTAAAEARRTNSAGVRPAARNTTSSSAKNASSMVLPTLRIDPSLLFAKVLSRKTALPPAGLSLQLITQQYAVIPPDHFPLAARCNCRLYRSLRLSGRMVAGSFFLRLPSAASNILSG